METVTLRRFRSGDESAVSDVICTTLSISNRKDYSPGFIEENIKSHSPEIIAARAEEAHFYVAMDGEIIIGCGGITGYWGSTEESYLTSIFVLPATGAVGFILAVILGLSLLFAGKYLWDLTRKYIAWIVRLKRTMLGQHQ